jgi:pyruvate-ferredoxin/flavodoxin oxidoreductase
MGRSDEKRVLSAVALAEGAVAERVLLGVEGGLDLPRTNVFGARIEVERVEPLTREMRLVRRLVEAKAKAERVSVVLPASELAPMRAELAQIARARLGVVVHVVGDGEGAGVAHAAVADLPWGVLLAAGEADALELALVARRAAEDSSYPFLVVHSAGIEHREPMPAEPSPEALVAYLGEPRAEAFGGGNHAGGGHETDASERVQFALASAMREIESLTGRRRDVVERAPRDTRSPALPEPGRNILNVTMAFVGAGALGEALLAEVDALRVVGHDVGAVRVVAWRPFPAARLVKMLSRALALTVLETRDMTATLAMHLKAAFADALTWAPDFPGIGAIPRIVSGYVAPEHALCTGDARAMVENMLRNDLGTRTFTLD